MKKLLLFLLLISFLKLEAQRIAGSEIYYKRTANRKYEITAVVYRECDSDPLTGINGYVFAGNSSMNLPFSRVSIQKINDTCNQPCQYINDNSRPGFERHTFVASVDFNDNSYKSFLSYCEVSFAILQGGRDNRTTTHGTGMYYNEAIVNICDSTIGNTSPRFSMDPKFIVSGNWTLEYSPGPIDTMDFDSMAFELVSVKTNYTNTISYNISFSNENPLTSYCPPYNNNCTALPTAKPARGFYFDKSRCQIIFTPINIGDLGYVRIKASEYRRVGNKTVYLGSVFREMLVNVVGSTNSPPYFNQPNSSALINNCSDILNLTLIAKDDTNIPLQTIPDTTNIIYDGAYQSSKFTLNKNNREASATLALKNKKGLNSPQLFTVGISDKQCNIGLVSRTYLAKQYPIVDFNTYYSIDTCNRLTADVKLKDSTLTKSGYIQIKSPDGLLKAYSGNFSLNQNGRYIIQYNYTSMGNACYTIKYETFTISNAFPVPDLNQKSDTIVCRSAPVNLKFEPSRVNNLVSWTWYKNDSNINSSDSFITDTFKVKSKYKLELKNSKGCYSSREFKFTEKFLDQNILPISELSICPDLDTTINTYTSSFKQPVSYKWQYNGDTVIQSGNSYNFRTHEGLKRKTLFVTAIDDNHCIFTDSLHISTYSSPKYVVNHDKPLCINNWVQFRIDSLKSNNIKQIRWSTPTYILSTNTMTVTRLIDLPTQLLSYALDSNNCRHADTQQIVPLIIPEVSISNIKSSYCTGQSVTAIAKINKGYVPNISWYLDQKLVKTGDTFYSMKAQDNGIIHVRVNNANSCFDRDSASFIVVPYPVVNIIGDTLYNYLNRIDLRSDRTLPNYYWSTGSALPNLTNWASDFGPPGRYRIWLRSYNNLGCSTYDTIYIRTDARTEIEKVSNGKIIVYPNPAVDHITIESEEMLNYKLFDSEGKLLLSGLMRETTETIDLTGLNSGIYILEFNGYKYKITKI